MAQTAELDVTLELGAVSETVEVRAETPLLDTAGATLGEVVNSIAAVNLPLNGRDVLQLVALAPGVNVAPKYRTATTGSGDVFAVAFSANGGRSLSNTILLDGSPQEVTGYSPPVYVPPPDAIQEFRVQTNSLSAEYGRTGGAVVNMTHRSGTSEFHGALWEFLRNDVLDAAGFFNNRNETPKPALRYNQFGATLGGPLTPSRRTAFFFLSYEGNRQVSPEPATFTVPTAKLKTGDFSEAGAVIYDPLTINGAGRAPAVPRQPHRPVAHQCRGAQAALLLSGAQPARRRQQLLFAGRQPDRQQRRQRQDRPARLRPAEPVRPLLLDQPGYAVGRSVSRPGVPRAR